MPDLRPTVVTFPAGDLVAWTEVTAVVGADEVASLGRADAGVGVVTAVSPFHPVDPTWPDQPADRGTLAADGSPAEVVDVVVGVTQGANLLFATNIPERRSEAGRSLVVVHLLASGAPIPRLGQRVELAVEGRYRDELSRGHTACHLAALALNAALTGQWRKPIPPDGLGHPNFDRQALASSRIHPDAAVDSYRLGKSLRKRGFDADFEIGSVGAAINSRLAGWVAAGASIRLETQGPTLADHRTWVCELAEGTERIPCGGTHPGSLAGIAAIQVRLSRGDAELVMETRVTPT